jgi:hypothetical protein
MSETPKFEVIDRRKFKAEEEQAAARTPAPEPAAAHEPAATGSGPRLVVNEAKSESGPEPAPEAGHASELDDQIVDLPPPPTAAESQEQKTAYDASAQRLEDLVRAQNPSMGAPEAVGFLHLVQQLYMSAMIQLGAGAPEGQRPRVDILGARQTIDMLAILAEKTRGNLTAEEDRALQAVLYEARMGFLELTRLITLQAMQPPQPPPPQGKR